MSKDFINKLEHSLPGSSSHERSKWAYKIIKEDIDITNLLPLLYRDESIASRFIWLLSQAAEINPNKVQDILPSLLKQRHKINYTKSEASFANMWLLAGVPVENEATVIDLLFKWLNSSDTDVTCKSRSMLVLLKLCEKYPEIKNELRLCIEDQMNKHSDNFLKKSKNILSELEKLILNNKHRISHSE